MKIIGITAGFNHSDEIAKINVNARYLEYLQKYLSKNLQTEDALLSIIDYHSLPIASELKYQSDLDNNYIAKIAEKLDALVLSGGISLHPVWSNIRNLTVSGDVNIRRDSFEISLYKKMLELNKPVFGICRGLQVMLVSHNLSLEQSLSSISDSKVCHFVSDTSRDTLIHRAKVESKDGILAKNFGISEDFLVNSIHDQGHIFNKFADASIIKKEKIRIEALSDDNVIEMISIIDKKAFGVQFHPEEMKNSTLSENLINYFLELI